MSDMQEVAVGEGLWESVLGVAPLVLIGSREPDGSHDLAPKHRVLQLSDGHFGFVCCERHRTFRNVAREKTFTASWPRPAQIVEVSAAAAPRCEDGEKRTLRALPVDPASAVEGVLLADAYFAIECELDRVIDGFGEDQLVVGRVVAAHASPDALRTRHRTDEKLVAESPLLTYLHPSQFATIEKSVGFPFPKSFSR